MNAINRSEIFKELCQLALAELDVLLPERVQQIWKQEIELKVKASLEEPEFITDPT
jgi:hypothetical protein